MNKNKELQKGESADVANICCQLLHGVAGWSKPFDGWDVWDATYVAFGAPSHRRQIRHDPEGLEQLALGLVECPGLHPDPLELGAVIVHADAHDVRGLGVGLLGGQEGAGGYLGAVFVVH